MDIFFSDPSEVPLPPEEVRIRSLKADPWPDGKRVRVSVELDPFQKRPSVDLTIRNNEKLKVASASIVETMVRKLELTMHLRGEDSQGEHSLSAVLFYTDEKEDQNQENEGEQPERTTRVIDRSEIIFSIDRIED